jgi:hypothetical protein
MSTNEDIQNVLVALGKKIEHLSSDKVLLQNQANAAKVCMEQKLRP